MFEITKEITFEEVLEKIEEAKNIGIVGLVFAICAIVLVALFFCAYLEIDKMNDKKIANLENLLSQEVEKNRDLEYKVRFYCDRAIYLPNGKVIKDGKVVKGKQK